MLYILESTKGKKPHKHFVDIAPENVGGLGFITSSTAENHSHPVHIDGNGNVTVESVSFKKEKAPHTHTLIALAEYKKEKEEKPDENDDELLKSLRERFYEVHNLEKLSREKALESEKFYEGDQWNPNDVAILESERRAHITINETQSKVDLLGGFQRQNRTDARYYPIEDGDIRVAEALTILTDHILNQNRMELVESAVFKDESIAGRGNFHAYIDYSKNVFGDIKVESMGWRDVYYGPHEKLDVSDCEYIIKSKWFAKEKLKKLHPEKEEEIDLMWTSYLSGNDSPTVHLNIPGKEYTVENNPMSLNKYDIDISRKMIRVYEMWEKDYDKSYSIVNPDTEQIVDFEDLTSSDIKAIESLGLSVIEKINTKMRVTTAIGNILLNSRYDDLDMFPVIPAYAKKGTTKFYGLVEALKEPQMEVNKRHSQAIDVVNRVASYGYYYDNDTFADQREEQEFRANSAKSGFIAKVKNTNKIPVKQEGVRMPSELVGMMELASAKIEKISNISPEMMGFNQREISSVALLESKRLGLQAHEYLFDNLHQAKKQLCLLLIRYMKKVYSVERILRILNSKNPGDEKQAQINALNAQAAYTILETADLANYDVNIDMSPNSPSNRAATLQFYMELMARGVNLPPEILIDAIDVPAKDQIKASFASQAAAAAAEAKAKTDSEVEKTRVAAQAKIDAEMIKQGGKPYTQSATQPIPQSQPMMTPDQMQMMQTGQTIPTGAV